MAIFGGTRIWLNAEEILELYGPNSGITACMDTTRKGVDMNKFKDWVAKQYPNTEDYLLVWGFVANSGGLNEKEAFLHISISPATFLGKIKTYNELMKDES